MADGGPKSSPLPQFSEFKPVAVGIGIWLVLLLGALFIHDDLVADGHGWWLWTAFAGTVQGIAGYGYLLHRASRLPATDS